jgi:hypothetical protein
MAMTNAEAQKRWRDKRNKLAREASGLRNRPLDFHVADRIKRGQITASDRLRCVKLLLETIDRGDDDDREENAALLSWLLTWLGRLDKPAPRRRGKK